MRQRITKIAFYVAVGLIIFAGQFLFNHGLVTGKPPAITQPLISGADAMPVVEKGPAVIYFWAEWCGVCDMMQAPVSELSKQYPVLTIAVKSGGKQQLQNYLAEKSLSWHVVSDPQGRLAERYQARGVPSIFFLKKSQEVLHPSTDKNSIKFPDL